MSTTASRNGQASTTSLTSYTYEYFDTPLQSTITFQPDVNATATNTTTISYTGQGVLFSADIHDGRPRLVNYQADALGQVIRRDEDDNVTTTGDPHEVWFRYDGRELGHVSNNGTLETDYAGSIAARGAAQGTGPFRNGATTPTASAEFDAGYQPLTSYDQGSDGGSYTVQTGDTLQSIAQRLWGDASLWYKIAQANGLGTNSQLVEGQVLMLPRGIVRSANSASTFRAYDPGSVVGDLQPDASSPTQPQPQAKKKKNKCGIFGAILLTVVAVAVTAVTLGSATAALGPVLGGAVAGAAGAVASQVVGLATGIQDKFSFKGVALAALAGGIGGALGGGAIGKSQFLGDALRGAAGSALTQGVALVTGLQSKFDFAGVAAAGLGAGVGGAAGKALGKANVGRIGVRVGSATASGLAIAASESLINGTSFGDNLVAALPQVIGQTVGSLLTTAPRVGPASSATGSGTSRPGGPAMYASDLMGLPGQGGSPSPADAGSEDEIVVTAPSRGRTAAGVIQNVARTVGNSLGNNPQAASSSGKPLAPATIVPYAIDFGTHNQRLQNFVAQSAVNDPDFTKYDYSDVVAGFDAEAAYINRINAAAAPELARTNLFFGGLIAASAAPLAAPLLAEGGAIAAVGGLGLAASANNASGITAPFTGATRPLLDIATFNGASQALDIAAGATSVVAGGAALTRVGIRSLGSVGSAETTVPYGFSTADEFSRFGSGLHGGLTDAGYMNAQGVLQGSAVTGTSFRTGAAFDVGRVSDLDVALTGDSLFQAAQDAGIGLRSAGTRTGPLNERALQKLGLFDLSTQLSTQAGRPVNFMIYQSTEAAVGRAQSIIIPR